MFVFIFTSQIHPQNSLRPPQADVATQHNLRPPQADEINKNILRSNTKNLLHKTPKARKILAAGEFQGSSLLTAHDNIWGRGPKWLSSAVRVERARRNPNLPAEPPHYLRITPPYLIPSPLQAPPEGRF